MVDRQVRSDPACPGSEVAIGAKPVPRAVNAPKSLNRQILGDTWVTHNAHGPGEDVALKLPYQHLERIDLAMREPLEPVHKLLYRVLRDTNTQVTSFFGDTTVSISDDATHSNCAIPQEGIAPEEEMQGMRIKGG